MAQYSIKDVEVLSGVKAHTLRMWEQRYHFLKPERTNTNIRYYTDEQLKRLLNISLLNRHGFKISKIAGMSEDDLTREVLTISEQPQSADDLLDSLTKAMIEFDEKRFEAVFSKAIMKLGFMQAFSELVFPFMIRTGVLWATGTVRPAQEHFVSNLVRRKLCVAIDNQYVEATPDTKKFVLFLPEGETHELLLLFTEYMLRANNHEVAYLGNSVPFDDVAFVNNTFHPDYLITYFTLPMPDNDLQGYINKLAAAFPHIKLLVGGIQLELQKPQLSANVTIVNGIDQLMGAIK